MGRQRILLRGGATERVAYSSRHTNEPSLNYRTNPSPQGRRGA